MLVYQRWDLRLKSGSAKVLLMSWRVAVIAFKREYRYRAYINYVETYHPFSTYYHEIKVYIQNGQKDEW